MKVLLIEDSVENAIKLRKVVLDTYSDCVVNVSQSLQEADFVWTTYDLIILDLGIEGSDYRKVIDWIENKSSQLSIVIHTYEESEEIREACLDAGAVGMLAKDAVTIEQVRVTMLQVSQLTDVERLRIRISRLTSEIDCLANGCY